jgi:hypothetical protein
LQVIDVGGRGEMLVEIFFLGQRSICHIISSGEDWLGYAGLQNGRE